MPTKTKKDTEPVEAPAEDTAPPEPVFTVEAPAREVIDRINATVPLDLHAVRGAAVAAFRALDDGGNKPTTVHINLQPGAILAITVAQEPE